MLDFYTEDSSRLFDSVHNFKSNDAARLIADETGVISNGLIKPAQLHFSQVFEVDSIGAARTGGVKHLDVFCCTTWNGFLALFADLPLPLEKLQHKEAP